MIRIISGRGANNFSAEPRKDSEINPDIMVKYWGIVIAINFQSCKNIIMLSILKI